MESERQGENGTERVIERVTVREREKQTKRQARGR